MVLRTILKTLVLFLGAKHTTANNVTPLVSILPAGRVSTPTAFSFLNINLETKWIRGQVSHLEEHIDGLFQNFTGSIYIATVYQRRYKKVTEEMHTLLNATNATDKRATRDILGWGLGATALGLGIYNEVQLGQIKSKVATNGLKVHSMEQKVATMVKEMAEIYNQEQDEMKTLSIRQALANSLALYEDATNQIEEVKISARTGHLPIKAMNLSHLSEEITLIAMDARAKGLKIPSFLEILSYQPTVHHSATGIEYRLAIPLMAKTYQMFQIHRAAWLTKSQLYVTQGYKKIIGASDEHFVKLSVTDLLLCHRHQEHFFCNEKMAQVAGKDKSCEAAIWRRDFKAMSRSCRATTRELPLVMEVGKNLYKTTTKGGTIITCPNNDRDIKGFDKNQTIYVPPNCKALVSDQLVITELADSDYHIKDDLSLEGNLDEVIELPTLKPFKFTVGRQLTYHDLSQYVVLLVITGLIVLVIAFLCQRYRKLRKAKPQSHMRNTV